MSLTFDIGIDIDDVLHPWFITAHAICEEAGVTNGVMPKSWRVADEYGISVDRWGEILELASEQLYMAPPIEGAVEAVRRLYFEGHRIHLITARGTGSWQSQKQSKLICDLTEAWVEEYAVPHHSLVFTKAKGAAAKNLKLDFFIDDSVANFQHLEIAADECQTYLLTAPHNGDFYTPFRLETMHEFADLVLEAAEKGAVAR